MGLRSAERLVRQADEVEPMPAVVADLNEDLILVSLDHRAYSPGRPATRLGQEFDDVQLGMSAWRIHQL
jgi:hypothetical protein